MWLTPYFSSPLWEDAVASAITLAVCVTWLLLVKLAVKSGALEQRLSRKVVHIFTGPLFLLCWNLFSAQPSARGAAALVPLLITTQFLLTGLGLLHDPETVAAISRSGNPRELLHGPLFYGLIFVFVTMACWRHTPVGIAGLMVLCGGDGLAEVVGRYYGGAPERKLPWAAPKSWPGSAAMLLGSFIFSYIFVWLFNFWGNFDPPLCSGSAALVLLFIALVAALAESVCWEQWDNVIVPLLAIALAWLMLPLMECPGVPGHIGSASE